KTTPAKEPAKEAPKNTAPPAPVESPEQIKLAAVRAELAPLQREFHFSAALDALQRKLDDQSLGDIRETLLKDKADLVEVIAWRQRAVDAMRAVKDNPLTWKMGKVSVPGQPMDDPANAGLKIKSNDGLEMTLSIDDLEASDIETYAPPASGAER